MAKTMTAQGAADVLALKDTQPTLQGEVQLWFEDIQAQRLDQGTSAGPTTIDADQGRLETRHSWMPSAIACLGVKTSWAHITRVGLGESSREVGGEGAMAQRVFLTSRPCDAMRFAQAVRGHWGIEDALHGVLAVRLREDDGRMRQGHGAQNLVVLRQMALHLWRRASGHKRGIKARRKRAGWDRDYLFQV